MAYLFNGATHIISRSDAVLQSWPITLHGRIRLTNPGDGLDHTIVGLWEAGSNNGFRLQVEFPGSLTKARCGTKAGGSASNATSSTTITDTNWHSVVGEITSASARQVWLDNGGNGSSSTSLTPGTLTKTTAGAYDNGGTLGGNVAHELADIAVWSVTLTSDERASLAAGVSPLLIRPDKLEIYLPLMRGGNDYMGGAFTVTGATVADHPRVYMPSRAQQLVKTAVGGTTYNDTLTSTATASDGVTVTATFATTLTETASATDGYVGGSIFNDTLGQSATATDGFTVVATFAPALTETATGADTITALATFNATLSQGVTATDNYIGGSIFNDTLTQSATAGDSVTNLITFNPTLTEAATGGDSFAVIAKFAAAYSDSATAGFSLSDGSAASIWTTIAPASGTWGAQSASTGVWTTLTPSTGTWT